MKTITKTIKVNDISKSYDLSTITTYPYYGVSGSTIGYYRVIIDNNRQDRTLEKDIDKKIKNIRIVYEIEQEILDEGEKEYLSNIIKPFKNKVVAIKKNEGDCNREYIEIDLGDDDMKTNLPVLILKENVILPFFELKLEVSNTSDKKSKSCSF